MNKRMIVKAAIEKGGATHDSLMAEADVNSKGLASLFTYLRWSGICPVKGEDGIYKLIPEEEWEKIKAERGTGASTAALTPEARFEKAEKRQGRAASALDKAKTRKENAPDDKVYDLQYDKAVIELQIAELLVGRAEAEVKANPTPIEEVPELETETETEPEPEPITAEDEAELENEAKLEDEMLDTEDDFL